MTAAATRSPAAGHTKPSSRPHVAATRVREETQAAARARPEASGEDIHDTAERWRSVYNRANPAVLEPVAPGPSTVNASRRRPRPLMSPRPPLPRRCRSIAAFLLLAHAHRPRARRPRRRALGTAHLCRARVALPLVVRPRRDAQPDHAVHGALRRARRPREVHARRPSGQEPGRGVVGLQGRPGLRVHPQEGNQVPQRGRDDGRGRQVLVRALPRRRRPSCSRIRLGRGGGGGLRTRCDSGSRRRGSTS